MVATQTVTNEAKLNRRASAKERLSDIRFDGTQKEMEEILESLASGVRSMSREIVLINGNVKMLKDKAERDVKNK